jgi:hypothetical protein
MWKITTCGFTPEEVLDRPNLARVCCDVLRPDLRDYYYCGF